MCCSRQRSRHSSFLRAPGAPTAASASARSVAAASRRATTCPASSSRTSRTTSRSASSTAKRLADGVKIIEKSYTDRGVQAAADPHLRQLPRAARAARTSTRWSSARRITGTPRSRWPPSNAGKDVYLQKPFTMTHAEGVILRDAVQAPRAHPAGRQPAAFLGTVPPRRRAHPLRPHRQRAARGDRPADRSDRARCAARSRFRRTSISASG